MNPNFFHQCLSLRPVIGNLVLGKRNLTVAKLDLQSFPSRDVSSKTKTAMKMLLTIDVLINVHTG